MRHQRTGESHGERRLLEALLHRPESLAEVRELVAPDDFARPGCRRAGGVALAAAARGWPAEDEAAALARELAGLRARRTGRRRPAARRGGCGSAASRAGVPREGAGAGPRAPGGPEAARLMQEIQQITTGHPGARAA